jgi:hypothetical protein
MRVIERGKWNHRAIGESLREAGRVTEQLKRVTERQVESKNQLEIVTQRLVEAQNSWREAGYSQSS